MLSNFAARLIFRQAILGSTLAGDRVYDSPVDALAGLVNKDANWSPAIAVFTGETIASTVKGQDLTGIAPISSLVVSIYVPPTAVITDGTTEVELNGRGGLATFALDMIAYQCRQALVMPENPWAALWPRFVTAYEKFTLSPPFLEVDDGLRIPARTLQIDFIPLADPTLGRPMTPSWQALYDLMIEQTGLAPLAEILKQAIETPSWIPDWSRTIMQLGLSQAAALNGGVQPLQVDPPHQQTTGLQQVDTYAEDDAGDVALLVDVSSPAP